MINFVRGEQVAADEADPNDRALIRLNAVMLSLGTFAQIFCLPGLRTVVRSGTGTLATLGLPTAHIHVSAKKSVDRAACVLGVLGSSFKTCRMCFGSLSGGKHKAKL